MDEEQSITVKQHRALFVESPGIAGTIAGYESWLVMRKLRPRAVATYLRELSQFAHFLGDDATVADVVLETIERYQSSRAHLSGSTLGKSLSVIRSYCRYCIKNRLRADDPTLEIDWPQREVPPPRALTSRELRLLDAALDEEIGDWPEWRRRTRIRDQIAVLLMLYGGLRISEVAALKWKDIDLDAQTLLVRDAKGGKFRVIPLHSRLATLLRDIGAKEQRGAVCGRRDLKERSYNSLPHIFDRWLKDAGLEISAHQLRHTFATRMLWLGANLHEIQRLLGHASLATTERYLSLEIEQKRKAVDTLPERW